MCTTRFLASLSLALLILMPLELMAQRSQTPPRIVLPKQDNEALLLEELASRAPGRAPRFAVNIPVDIDPHNSGAWEYQPNGTAIWRVAIYSEGAHSLNLGFTRYVMPPGGALYLYSPDQSEHLGPFTPADNETHEQLWTPVLPGDEIVVEVRLPRQQIPNLQLELGYVNHDFLGFADLLSGSCNLDVICGAADGWAIVDAWRKEIQSVAIIGVNGSTFCTGFLVNNTRQDCTPYFMTAFHCGINPSNAPTFVAYWNFQNSTCRQPFTPQSGAIGDGKLNDFNTGAIFRAGWGPSDFTLIELDDPVSETANAYLAGWDASNNPPGDSVVCIHHPSTDEKRISFSFQKSFITFYFNNLPDTSGDHIGVPDWDIGTTEGGSSGSPLFNKHHRVIGQLHGGFAACGNEEADFYGWFHRSWTGGGTPSTRLMDWLDPDSTGILQLNGRPQYQCSYFVEAVDPSISICSIDTPTWQITVSELFSGPVDLSIPDLPAGVQAIFGSNPLAPGDTTSLILLFDTPLPQGQHAFTVNAANSLEQTSSQIMLTLLYDPPNVPVPSSPLDGATGLPPAVELLWENQSFASFFIEIATDSSFTNLVVAAGPLSGTSFTPPQPLLPQTTYYWRLKAINLCGESDWSAPASFTIASIYCFERTSSDVPKTIDEYTINTVTSTLEINQHGFIQDIDVKEIDINHTWVGDLNISITSPQGTTVQLMVGPDGGDCEEDDIYVSFDDEAQLPYLVLHNMCEPTPPAISGTFQPFNPLSAFDGEPMQGTWTLTIYDDFNGDGGSLRNWGLAICATIPDEAVLIQKETAPTTCINDGFTTELVLGTGFPDSTLVALELSGLPPNALVSFDPNPAPPGSTVTMVVSGTDSPGVWPLQVIASADTMTATLSFDWTVIGPPPAPSLLSPADDAAEVPLLVTFKWSQVPTASNYLLQVATDPAMAELIYAQSTPITSQSIELPDYCTPYYWRVQSIGDCGASFSEVYTLTSISDLSFSSSPSASMACPSDTLHGQLDAGSCFEASGLALEVSGTPPGAVFSFDTNILLPDGEANWTLVLTNTPPGNYEITMSGHDGTHAVNDKFALTVLPWPQAGALLSPANGEQINAPPPYQFKCEAVPGISTYRFEVSPDPDFQTVLVWANRPTNQWNTDFAFHQHGKDFFWRVIFQNECGSDTSEVYSFEMLWLAVRQVGGVNLELWPNPVSRYLFAKLDAPLAFPLKMEILSPLGQNLQRWILPAGQRSIQLDLEGLPAGLYLLRISGEQVLVVEKILRTGG